TTAATAGGVFWVNPPPAGTPGEQGAPPRAAPRARGRGPWARGGPAPPARGVGGASRPAPAPPARRAPGFGGGGRAGARRGGGGGGARALGAGGMCICGPNCFGLINVKAGMAAYSGPLARPLRAGPVALVSQSGGLGANVFAPLMVDRELGFSHFISSGNQLRAAIEDYVAYFLDDPDIRVVACIVTA